MYNYIIHMCTAQFMLNKRLYMCHTLTTTLHEWKLNNAFENLKCGAEIGKHSYHSKALVK